MVFECLDCLLGNEGMVHARLDQLVMGAYRADGNFHSL